MKDWGFGRAAPAPFYFLKAGTYIEFGAAVSSAWLIVALFFVKIVKAPAAFTLYTALVTVAILTAVVPTAIAQLPFKPAEEPQEMEAEVP